MKKVIIAIVFCLLSVVANAQFSGGFSVENNGHIYFKCINQSGYTVTVQILAKSSDRNNSEYQTVAHGGGLMLGPTTPWRWYFKYGDIVQITYPDGRYQYWTCPQNDVAYRNNSNPSFGGHGPLYGKCPGNRGTKWNPIMHNGHKICKNCGEGWSSHVGDGPSPDKAIK